MLIKSVDTFATWIEHTTLLLGQASLPMMMMMMMMMMNCFCGMVDRRIAFSLISSRDYCQRFSPSRIYDNPRAGFEPAQDLSSGLVEWSCAVVTTTIPQRHIWYECRLNILKTLVKHPQKAKTLLKEKTALLQEDEGHLFCEKFCLHLIQIERSKKKSLEVSNSDNKKNTPL